MVVNLDEMTELQDSSVFHLDKKSMIPYMEEDDLIQGIQIEVEANLTVTQRRSYNLVDLLSDVRDL